MMLESPLRFKVEFPIDDVIVYNKEVNEIWILKWQSSFKACKYSDIFLDGK